MNLFPQIEHEKRCLEVGEGAELALVVGVEPWVGVVWEVVRMCFGRCDDMRGVSAKCEGIEQPE